MSSKMHELSNEIYFITQIRSLPNQIISFGVLLYETYSAGSCRTERSHRAYLQLLINTILPELHLVGLLYIIG